MRASSRCAASRTTGADAIALLIRRLSLHDVVVSVFIVADYETGVDEHIELAFGSITIEHFDPDHEGQDGSAAPYTFSCNLATDPVC